jgi:predicted DNA-binding protein YlxM (UPF0122 family)
VDSRVYTAGLNVDKVEVRTVEVSISEIQERWKVSRATVYSHIKKGKLSRLENGKVDVSEVLRVYGEPKETQTRQEVDTVDSQEKALLLEKIRLLESQLDDAKERESWLKSQVETAQTTIKLLEYRQPVQSEKRQGLFARVVKAITE